MGTRVPVSTSTLSQGLIDRTCTGITTHAMNLLISKRVEEGKRDMSTSQRGYLTRRMRHGPLERVLHKEQLLVSISIPEEIFL